MLLNTTRKKNIVRFVTDNVGLLETYPIEKYIKSKPEFFKNSPNNINFDGEDVPYRTGKYCNGFIDLMQHAYLLKWNSDLVLNIDNKTDKFTYFPNANEHTYKDISWFNSQMYGDWIDNPKRYSNLVYKIGTHWQMIANQSSRFLLAEPYFDYNQQGKVMEGIVDARYFCDVNVMLETYVKEYKIKRGTNAMLYIPLDNQEVVCDMPTKEDLKQIKKINYNYQTSIYNSYNKAKEIIK